MNLEQKIRNIEGFPKEGIGFKDITTLLKDKDAFKYTIDEFKKILDEVEFDLILGPEARGFLIGAPLAYATYAGFVPVRKPGKLPAETISYEYDLEYGTDVLEIHKDAINEGDKIIIVDDLLATGGTAYSTCKMVEQLGGEVVGIYFLIELEFLNGIELLADYNVKSIIKY